VYGLFVAGSFATAGPVAVNNVARYDFTSQAWSALGVGVPTFAHSIAINRDGNVMFGGSFDLGSGSPSNVAVYDPATVTWSDIASAPNGTVRSLAYTVNGDLAVGGHFSSVGNVVSAYFAQLAEHPRPSILAQPLDATTCPSGSSVYSVSGIGTEPLSCRWEVESPAETWNELDGNLQILQCGAEAFALSPQSTTTVIRILACTTSSQSQRFRVRAAITDSCGTTISDPASYTICLADFDCSGLVSVQDIFDFLAAYFQQSVNADTNRSGEVTVQDIFDYLGAYFIGCF
jgi:hypothetical protein